MFKPGNEWMLEEFQNEVDKRWQALLDLEKLSIWYELYPKRCSFTIILGNYISVIAYFIYLLYTPNNKIVMNMINFSDIFLIYIDLWTKSVYNINIEKHFYNK